MNIKYLLLLKDIIKEKKSGELKAGTNKSIRILHFKKGELTYCFTTKEEEKLLNIIYNELNYMGKKRYKELLKYVQGSQQEKLKLGQKLVFDKIISPNQLYTALNKQMEKISENILNEKNIEISFQEEQQEGEIGPFGLKISTEKVFLESYKQGKVDKENEKLLNGKIIIKDKNEFSELLFNKDREILKKLKNKEKITKKTGKKSEIIKILLKLYVLGYIKIESVKKEELKEKGENNLCSKKEELLKEINPDGNTNNYNINDKENIKNNVIFSEEGGFDKIFSEEGKNKKVDEINNIKEIDKKARLLYKNGKYKDIVKLIRDIPNYNKLSGKTMLMLAKAEAKIEIYKADAEKHLLSLIKKEPWIQESYYELLSLYEKEKLTSRAKPIIKKALKFFPDEHKFYYFKEIFLNSKKIRLFNS